MTAAAFWTGASGSVAVVASSEVGAGSLSRREWVRRGLESPRRRVLAPQPRDAARARRAARAQLALGPLARPPCLRAIVALGDLDADEAATVGPAAPATMQARAESRVAMSLRGVSTLSLSAGGLSYLSPSPQSGQVEAESSNPGRLLAPARPTGQASALSPEPSTGTAPLEDSGAVPCGGACSTSLATSSTASTTSATALTTSSAFRFITRTPVAEWPCWEMPAAEVRWTIPPTLMKTSSWCSRTTSAPARPPFFSVSPIVFTPLAPRLVLRYWRIWGGLPSPS